MRPGKSLFFSWALPQHVSRNIENYFYCLHLISHFQFVNLVRKFVWLYAYTLLVQFLISVFE